MNYLKIDNCNMNNGDGLRCVVWVTGCEHRCKGCFNPETWDNKNGDKWTALQGSEILTTLVQDWCSGITFTGGDPLHPCNRKEVLDLCDYIKNTFHKSVWVYTGYKYEELDTSQLKNIDVLVDGEFIQEQLSPFKHWVGSSNQRIIDVKKSIKQNKVILYKGGYND